MNDTPAPVQQAAGGEQAPQYPTYIITQEPREVPRRKGPFFGKKMVEDFLREAYRYNPDIVCIVIDMETEDNTWHPEHGYEWLDVNGDRRKRHPRKDRPRSAQPPAPDVAGATDAERLEDLRLAAKSIRTYMPETLPAGEDGKIHFARALAESAAEAIEAFLATTENKP